MLDAVIEERTAASRRCFKNGQEWGKKCFEDLDQRRMGRPATRTWSTDFLLREESSREERGKWLKNKSVPWRRRRRLRQEVTGTFLCGQQMQKYGYRKTAACMLCQKAHEECYRRRQSATFRAQGALDKRRWSQPRTMRASGNCYKKSMCMGKADRHVKPLTIETESRLGTLSD